MESEGNVEVGLVREVGKPVFEMSRWLRFLGILMIIMSILGVIAILISLVAGFLGFWQSDVSENFRIGGVELLIIGFQILIPIIPVILYVWMGNLLFQSGKLGEPAYMRGDKQLLINSLSKLKTYFILLGILTLIGFVFSVLVICGIGIATILGVATTPWW